MSRYIKLADALRALADTCYLDEIDKNMQELPSIYIDDAVNKWIPCSERLPSENDFYLVTYPRIDGEPWVQVLRFSNGKFYSNDGWGDVEFDDVTAWMPRPKPYREREGE